MYIHYNFDAKPGVSAVELDRETERRLTEITKGISPNVFVVRAVENCKQRCTQAERARIINTTDPDAGILLKRELAAQRFRRRRLRYGDEKIPARAGHDDDPSGA